MRPLGCQYGNSFYFRSLYEILADMESGSIDEFNSYFRSLYEILEERRRGGEGHFRDSAISVLSMRFKVNRQTVNHCKDIPYISVLSMRFYASNHTIRSFYSLNYFRSLYEIQKCYNCGRLRN